MPQLYLVNALRDGGKEGKMKTEQEIVEKIIETSQDIQYCIDKIDHATLDEDTREIGNRLNMRKIELDTLTWLFN